jgi:hypothetical protein
LSGDGIATDKEPAATAGAAQSLLEQLESYPPDYEPLVDALIYEPIPYRTAVKCGCTHVLVLRSFPDGRSLPRSLLGIFEKLVAPKCLDPYPETQQHMQSGGHTLIYAQDILCLNEGANDLRKAADLSEVLRADPQRSGGGGGGGWWRWVVVVVEVFGGAECGGAVCGGDMCGGGGVWWWWCRCSVVVVCVVVVCVVVMCVAVMCGGVGVWWRWVVCGGGGVGCTSPRVIGEGLGARSTLHPNQWADR